MRFLTLLDDPQQVPQVSGAYPSTTRHPTAEREGETGGMVVEFDTIAVTTTASGL